MHNIDRTYLETGRDGFETFEGEGETLAAELEAAIGTAEYEGFETFEGEGEGEGEAIAAPGYLSEQEEVELASELLEISSEAELEQFLGKLISKASKGIRTFAKSAAGRQLGGILKAAAKTALPVLGGAAGAMFGGPLGAQAGSMLASGAGKLFGLELEGLSTEQAEFEVARQFVRFASTATGEVASTPPGVPARTAVRTGVVNAARQHAPGLTSPTTAPAARRSQVTSPGTSRSPIRQTGRWERRGRAIVVYL